MRKPTKTTILTDEEVAIVANGIRQALGEGVTLMAEAYGIDVEAMLRFMPLAEKCRIARDRKGASLKDAARALKTLQSRLKDIEGGRVKTVDQAVLLRYIEFLDLKRWFSRWKRQNRSFYESLRPNALQAKTSIATAGGENRLRGRNYSGAKRTAR